MTHGTERHLIWEALASYREGGSIPVGWDIHRARVPGGWLVLVMNNPTGLAFYPDPEHTWDGGSVR